MRSGHVRENGLTGGWPTLVAKSNQGSAPASNSDSIGGEIRVPSTPNREGQRPTRNAGLRGASIPCLQTPYSMQCLSFWSQPVPAISEDHLRQLNVSFARPDQLAGGLATTNRFPASHLHGALLGFLHTENARSEANPEV